MVFGGTGSIGTEIVSQLLKFNPKTIRILSNSENELWKTKLNFKDSIPKLRFILGDIRNYKRVEYALNNVDYVFNAAAIKHVFISEYNPLEAINVNIQGLENVIKATFKCNVKKLIHISTDKAVNPTTVMGVTKFLGEHLCVLRNLQNRTHLTKISCVRFGNVLGSRGSIIPLIKAQIKSGDVITLTDIKMKRFILSISQAVKLVLKAAYLAEGGEIFVFKMPTVFIKDLIEIIIEEYCPKIGKDPSMIRIEKIGPILGEKLNEELISPIEFSSCYETENMYIIYPLINIGHNIEIKKPKIKGLKVLNDKNFCYNTESSMPLKKEEIRNFLKNINLL